ncbi:MAG: IS110 family transposase [Hyphomonadaceae bacterium]
MRGHLAEYGLVVPQGAGHFKKLAAHLEDPASPLPDEVRSILSLLAQTASALDEKIGLLDKEITRRTREDEVARRLMTIPGIGPITATAIAALAPPASAFRRGRDFAAWVGLTPLQKSTGGRQKLGATSKMGERTIRRLLIIGAAAAIHHAVRRGVPPTTWLGRMLARKPRMLVTVAQANKTARIVWALLVKGEDYKSPEVAAA